MWQAQFLSSFRRFVLGISQGDSNGKERDGVPMGLVSTFSTDGRESLRLRGVSARGVRTEVGVFVLLAALVYAFARTANALSWNSTTRAIVAALGLACFILIAAPLIALARERRRLRRLASPPPAQLVIFKEVLRGEETMMGRLRSGGATAGRIGTGSGHASTRR
jgi:hypothetical protein